MKAPSTEHELWLSGGVHVNPDWGCCPSLSCSFALLMQQLYHSEETDVHVIEHDVLCVCGCQSKERHMWTATGVCVSVE